MSHHLSSQNTYLSKTVKLNSELQCNQYSRRMTTLKLAQKAVPRFLDRYHEDWFEVAREKISCEELEEALTSSGTENNI